MLDFKKYNSIENSYDKEFLDRIKWEGFGSRQYVVQEKVHGANCCFVTDGADVRFAKRTGLVESGELFYNYEELLSRYRVKIIDLFRSVKKMFDDVNSILVYGEMFGGSYPHPDVKRDSRFSAIQKGVFYSPIHDFYGFDIYLNSSDKNRYLDVDKVNYFFELHDFLYAKTLFTGALEECLAYPNEFQSNISQWLGLPPLEGNICEGIVIRPVEPAYLGNGSRVMIKSKNSKFAEKKSVKKHPVSERKEPSYSEELNNQLDIVEQYVTANRLDNVLSKTAQLSIPKDMGKLIGLLSKDILDDYLKEYSGDYFDLEKNEQKILNRHVNSRAVVLIKDMYRF